MLSVDLPVQSHKGLGWLLDSPERELTQQPHGREQQPSEFQEHANRSNEQGCSQPNHLSEKSANDGANRTDAPYDDAESGADPAL